ncbi:MAG: 4Fe-4S dicluster domain-containing protein, partial [Gammaproteobacteria bacterium]|nr:4Fe-4S dicluster domain-containing protein [Gammaproteobacteria bacterium]
MAIDMNVFRGFAEQIKMLPQMARPTDCPDNERVNHLKAVFSTKIDASNATQLESCVHCGLCAEACQFYIQTEDPELTPIHKLDLLKRYYRREKAPLRWLHRLIEPDITEADLEATQHLVYESCTECGRCGL